LAFVDQVPWDVENFISSVVGLIKRSGKGRPVLIVNDMTDQHFKGGQRIPNVSFLDKANVLKRKLQIAFPSYPIRGYLPIKVPKKASDGQSSTMYLFAAVPMSDNIVKTQAALKESGVDAAGFVMLPVEASGMVRILSEKVFEKKKEPTKWVIFIGQHKSGALRQVIIRNGYLAMTRMTPVNVDIGDVKAWANEVHQDFKATLGYLSRFGFTTEDGADIIVVANEAAGQALEEVIEIPCNYKSMSAKFAAKTLGLKISRDESDHYADILHAAWSAKKTTFTLPVSSPEIEKIQKPRKVASFLILALFLGGAYLSWLLATNFEQLSSARDDIRVQNNVLIQAKEEYEVEAARMAALGYDANLLRGAVLSFENFESERAPVVSIVNDISRAIGGNIRLDSLVIKKIDAGDSNNNILGNVNFLGVDDETAGATVEAVLALSFPSTVRPEEGVSEINRLRARLAAEFTDYQVDILKQVARPEYTQDARGVAGGIGETSSNAREEDYVAELIIRGAI